MFLSVKVSFFIYIVKNSYQHCSNHIPINLPDLSSSEAGLVISSAMSLVAQLQLCVRKATETENLMTSVERVMEYSRIPSEACFKTDSTIDMGKLN